MATRRLLRRLSRHPRLYRLWYSRALPWLIGRRAKARAWCERTRPGRLLCAPLPPGLVGLLATLGTVAALALLLLTLTLHLRLRCAALAQPPRCDPACTRWLLHRGTLDHASTRRWAADCWPSPWDLTEGETTNAAARH